MWRVHTSRWLNQQLGGQPDEMLSSRAYRERRTITVLIIDTLFVVLTLQRQHCKRAHIWEKRFEETSKRRVATTQKETSAHETYPAVLEAQTQGGGQ